jgi:hypothetical protein
MNRRDIELLSAYLDGQLKPSDSTRLESRLKSDPDLVAVMDDLRAARNLLRKLPQRRAPRNFTLTRKMVGQNPPMPRAYPFFRFATTLATLLLFFTFGLNFLAPQMAAAPGFGMGGGGSEEDLFSAQEAQPAIAEAPAATELPATEAPSAEMLPMPTQMSTLDSARNADTPAEKIDATGNAVGEDQSQVANEVPTPVSIGWQLTLAGIALLGALLMLLMRQSAFQRWRQKE